jgi:two-component system NtrC family sensor kinase
VFVNLGHNAIEAMNGRGRVKITVAAVAGSFEVRVDDEGPGIPPDKVTRIFEPFFSEKERGVGMGLAICSRIVTAHDGTIRAGSREGGGASLIVRLPASQGKEN